jgi:hypothetical protein
MDSAERGQCKGDSHICGGWLLADTLDNIEQGDSQYQITTLTFINAVHQPKTPPPGSIVIPDLYELYVNSLPQGAVPDHLVVVKESSAL